MAPPRSSTPPPSDVARLRVALWNLAGQLGIDLDSSMADHQVAELIAHRMSHAPSWADTQIKIGDQVFKVVEVPSGQE